MIQFILAIIALVLSVFSAAPTTVPTAVETNTTTMAADIATASWYGSESGTVTANGEVFDPFGLTFANLHMGFGTLVEFCVHGSCVVARCTDRGPAAWTGRQFDLSEGAFQQIAPLSQGVAQVVWRVVS